MYKWQGFAKNVPFPVGFGCHPSLILPEACDSQVGA